MFLLVQMHNQWIGEEKQVMLLNDLLHWLGLQKVNMKGAAAVGLYFLLCDVGEGPGLLNKLDWAKRSINRPRLW